MIGVSNVFKLITVMFIVALLVACPFEDEDPKRPPVVIPGSGINIDGDWKTDCGYLPEKDVGIIVSFNFSKDNFTQKQYYYSDSTCTQLKDSEEFPGRITHHGTEEIKTSLGEAAYEKDFKYENGVKQETLVAFDNNENTLYIASSDNGNVRPDDITSDNSFKLSKGTVPPPPKHVDIDGTWKTDCIYLEDDKRGLDFIFKVSGNSFSFRTNAYSDNSCSQSEGSKLDSGKITYGKEEITTPSGLTAHEIDLRYENGDVWKSLVANLGNELILNPDIEGTGRPDDIDRGFLFTKQ